MKLSTSLSATTLNTLPSRGYVPPPQCAFNHYPVWVASGTNGYYVCRPNVTLTPQPQPFWKTLGIGLGIAVGIPAIIELGRGLFESRKEEPPPRSIYYRGPPRTEEYFNQELRQTGSVGIGMEYAGEEPRTQGECPNGECGTDRPVDQPSMLRQFGRDIQDTLVQQQRPPLFNGQRQVLPSNIRINSDGGFNARPLEDVAVGSGRTISKSDISQSRNYGPLDWRTSHPAIANYSASSNVQGLIRDIEADAADRLRQTGQIYGGGRCYHAVKKALVKNNLIRNNGDVPAVSAAQRLTRDDGFFNLLELENPKIEHPIQAPKGAILVYSTGRTCPGTSPSVYNRWPASYRNDCGTIEVKTADSGQAGYVKDFKHPGSRSALEYGTPGFRNVKLIAVLVKPVNGSP